MWQQAQQRLDQQVELAFQAEKAAVIAEYRHNTITSVSCSHSAQAERKKSQS